MSVDSTIGRGHVLEWNESIATGVPEIDEQHRALLAHIKKLQAAQAIRDKRAVVQATVNELFVYMFQHFKAEERIMKQREYPGYIEHKEIHGKFKRDAYYFQVDCNENVDTFDNLLVFLESWWKNHVGGVDVAMGKSLRNS